MDRLTELARREGYTLLIDDGAADHPDALGQPQRDELCAQACKGNVIRIRSGISEGDAWYPVSHEIAEDRNDFRGHTQKLWREQLSILSRWCRRLAESSQESKVKSQKSSFPESSFSDTP